MAQQRQDRRLNYWIYLVIVSIILITFACSCGKASTISVPTHTPPTERGNVMKLPEPRYDSKMFLEESLLQRRYILKC